MSYLENLRRQLSSILKKGDCADKDLILALQYGIEYNNGNSDAVESFSLDNNSVIKTTFLCRENIRCSICNKIADSINTIQLNCNHVFCSECLSEYIRNIGLETMGYKCPDGYCIFYFQLDKWAVNCEIITDNELKANQSYIEKKLSQLESQKSETNLFNVSFIHKEFVLCSIRAEEPQTLKSVELQCGHIMCKKCFKHFILELENNESSEYICPKCNKPFKLIQSQCNGDKQLKNIFEKNEKKMNLAPLLENGDLAECPNCKLIFYIEVGEVHKQITGEKDDEGNVITLKQIQARDKYRVRCSKCETIWCRNCSKIPFHLGKTCEEYNVFLRIKKCRYCHKKLNAIRNCDVCSDEDCYNKLVIGCQKKLKCGHYCCGLLHSPCLPCFNPKCSDNNKIDGNEYCTICYSEGLSDSPCIILKCGHIFHYNCVIEKIKNKWSGIRISFGYLECPQCRKIMEHPSINEIIHPELKLLDTVKRACLSYIKVENMMNDKELTNPSSEFYNKPEEYGLKKFAFYLCDECHKPYYAGLAECGEPPADEIPKKLCSDCQFRGSNIQECPKHGKEFIQFKCRFCCNYSKWFCWNTTHFCEACHQKSTTLPKLPKDQLPKCPGKDKCPLGVDHPPNGEEYCLGCGLCRFENAGLT